MKSTQTQFICHLCNQIYFEKKSRIGKTKYCSRKCQHLAKKGSVPWNKGKTKKDFPILGAKQSKRIGWSPWNKGLKIPEMSGENHPNWIKDRTQIKQYWTERNNPEYKQWRQSVYLRDGFKCKINNEDCSGKLEAHHILRWNEYPELRYDTNNGITLCHSHHPRKREEEKRLETYFKGLVSVSKE